MFKQILCLYLIYNQFNFSQQAFPYLIGVLTLDISKRHNMPADYTYVFTSYIKWLEQNNLRWIQISIHDSHKALYRKLKMVDGVFLTGGNQELRDSKNNPTPYQQTLKIIFDYAKFMNDKNIIFPVIGTCLGFESLVSMLTGEKFNLTKALNQNNSETIYLLPDAQQSFLTQLFTYQELDVFKNRHIFYFSHIYGFLMKDVEKSEEFQSQFKALGFYLTNEGEKALGIVQHKKYPFAAWQFHPEKIQFEHNDFKDINKSQKSLHINAKFSKIYNLFLKGQQAKLTTNLEVLDIRKNVVLKENFNKNDEAYIFPADV